MSPADFDAVVIPELRAASENPDPISALKGVIGSFFPNLAASIFDDALHLSLESSRFSILIKGEDSFLTFENSNPNGGSLVGFSDGRPCDAKELLKELVNF
ncbi:hypothetical protein ACUX4Q_24565, partial [Salmonella enterica]